MIYQLYPSDKEKPAKSLGKYYKLFCLECLKNEHVAELKMEYSAMVYLYYNKLDNDDWIGFTSYRQNIKSNFILNELNFNYTINLLKDYDILCWLFYKFNVSLSNQAEFYHKKITKNIEYLFLYIFKEEIPKNYYFDNCGCFANYWIMTKKNFNEFMDWSYPKVLKIIELSNKNIDFKLDKHYCNSNFIIERLYIIWYMKFNKRIYPLYQKYKNINE